MAALKKGNKHFIKYGIIAIAGIGLIFFLLEGGMRIAGIKPLYFNERMFHDFRAMHQLSPEKELVYELKPGIEKSFAVIRNGNDYRGPVNYKISKQGTRSPAVAVSKPLNSYRILFLGDSITFGFDIDYEKTFTALLEQKLRNKEQKRVEIINAGVLGFNTHQELSWLKKNGMKLQPDMIVLVLSPNDVDDPVSHFGHASVLKMADDIPIEAVPDPDSYRKKLAALKELYKGKELKEGLQLSPVLKFKLFLAENSALIESMRLYLQNRRNKNSTTDINSDKIYMHCLKRVSIPGNPEIKWLSMQLKQLKYLSKKHQFKLLVVYLPLSHQVRHSQLMTYSKPFLDLIKKLEIPYIDCSTILKSSGDNLFLEDDCHFNEKGHRVIAEELKPYLFRTDFRTE